MASSERIPAEERIFSLLLALIATEGGLTKAEILSTVQGYSSRYEVGGDNASLERQFERDKDELRAMGIPLETLDDPSEPGNNQRSRYLISRAEYELPADITFDAQEMTLLGLAAAAWREGSLSHDSSQAIMKLAAQGKQLDPLLGVAPRIQTLEAAFAPLRDAISSGIVVQFNYRKPGQRESKSRTVYPLALAMHEGRWFLGAYDEDAKGNRTFLLSRIVSAVTKTRRRFEPSHDDVASQMLDELRDLWANNRARVRVAPGSDAELRLSVLGQHEGDTITLPYTDIALCADELVSYGQEVTCLEPPELVEAVKERLRTLATLHGGENVR